MVTVAKELKQEDTVLKKTFEVNVVDNKGKLWREVSS